MKKKVFSFLRKKEQKLCVLATASRDGKPECAIMGYAVTDDCRFILSTQKNTRKWHNIKRNNQVSLVVGWNFTEMNLQCDGSARGIEDGPEYTELIEFFFTKNKSPKEFKTDNTVFIEVTPQWIRLLDLSHRPPQIEEITL